MGVSLSDNAHIIVDLIKMAKQVNQDAQKPVQTERTTNLFMTVNTLDVSGKNVGYRVVDLYHYGTRNWLMSHQWWSMHQGHLVEVCPASQADIDEYMAKRAKELQDKFNEEPVAA